MEESNRDIRTPVYQRVASFDSFGFAIFESEVEKEVQEAEPRSHEDRSVHTIKSNFLACSLA